MKNLVEIPSLSSEMRQLVKAAVSAQQHAYCPYSLFAVGAALLHHDNSITCGCNYENCTLQACCAERCAIVSANSRGLRLSKAVAIYGSPCKINEEVTTENSNNSNNETTSKESDNDNTLCLPCGLCRQLLLEVAQLSKNLNTFQVICPTRDEAKVAIFLLCDLLPLPFGPIDVGVNLQYWAIDTNNKN